MPDVSSSYRLNSRKILRPGSIRRRLARVGMGVLMFPGLLYFSGHELGRSAGWCMKTTNERMHIVFVKFDVEHARLHDVTVTTVSLGRYRDA